MSAKFPTIFSFPGSQHRLKFSSDIAAAPCNQNNTITGPKYQVFSNKMAPFDTSLYFSVDFA
jgi:hypothetical protein